ncbi:MAG: 4-hydroxy-tetrahydrodipicolinate reductase [Oscillospiraceae bacterium]|jgi:4-hydroxy-tetrahydrodipicolinate reductase|nr:4-hydroxy-tetrahydrodipicolinate reductase [Oscillospiraceae bacterium]
MLTIFLSGCYGKLCHAVTECADTQEDLRITGGIDQATGKGALPFPVYPSPAAVQGGKPDVIIDCSHPSILPGLLEYALRERVPLVIATTGYGATEHSLLAEAAKRIPVFYGRNMSLGVSLLKELAKSAARVLGSGFDVEIVEAHHNQKIDAPSGTALLLAEAVNEVLDEPYAFAYERQSRSEPRRHSEIGIHSIRGGSIVGDHSVIFAGFDEVITLQHSAGSKRLFAAGCVSAARFIVRQEPGCYGMDDLVRICG